MGFWTKVGELIRQVDVVVEVIDARVPELSRNRDIESLIEKNRKAVVRVFNKIDLMSDESLKKLMTENRNGFFVSVRTGRGISALRDRLKIMAKESEYEMKVGFVGYPNAGKSSLINFLIRSAKAKVSKKAGTTRGVQWINFSNWKILDSPGVIPNNEWNETKLTLINAKNLNRLRNPEKVALGIIDLFLEKNPRGLKERYGIKEDVSGKESWEILEIIAKEKKLLKKKGEIDENRAAFMIITDWQNGRLRL